MVTPDGERRTLLRVSRYDPMWQLRYHLAEELVLKKGTRLEVTSTFDNSPGNPLNPDPHRPGAVGRSDVGRDGARGLRGGGAARGRPTGPDRSAQSMTGRRLSRHEDTFEDPILRGHSAGRSRPHSARPDGAASHRRACLPRAGRPRRTSGPERRVAGAEHRELRPRAPSCARRHGPSTRPLRTGAGEGSAGAGRGRRGARRAWASSRAARSPTSPRRWRSKRENQAELARARSGDQVLPAGRSARQLHAVPVPDLPLRAGAALRLRVRRARRATSSSRTRARRRWTSWMGQSVGQLGRRHAGGRRHRRRTTSTWLDRAGNHHSRPDEGHRALHADRPEHACATRPTIDRSGDLHAAVEDRA